MSARVMEAFEGPIPSSPGQVSPPGDRHPIGSISSADAIPLVFVRDVTRSLSAASTLDEVGDALDTWVARLVAPDARGRVWIWDGPGLRVIPDSANEDAMEAAVRRALWLGRAPQIVPASKGRVHLLLPLGDEPSHGALDVEGPSLDVDDARPALEILAAMAGLALARAGHDSMRIDDPGTEAGEDGLEGALAWASHELRAPMRATRLALGHVLDEATLEPAQSDLIRRSAETLDRFTGDLEQILSWASTSGTGTLRRDPVDLSLLVADVIDTVSEPRQGDRVITALDDSVLVQGDEVHLRSAITNLFRNALQHSPPRSAVYVSLAARAGEAVLAVTNTGSLLPSERSEVFGRFSRGRAGGFRGSGSGLGLFVADRVARAHGGHILAESTGMDVTFTMRLRSAGR